MKTKNHLWLLFRILAFEGHGMKCFCEDSTPLSFRESAVEALLLASE
jgi:hypothetical protein